MADGIAPGFIEQCQLHLRSEWDAIVSSTASSEKDPIPAEVTEAIADSINSKTRTYRYVLPAQLLAKAVDASLDCRAVQAGCGLDGAFDARSVCQKVIVPFDRENNSVLGGSPEPYANNPLRIGAIVAENRGAQKDKDGFDRLVAVLEFAQSNGDLALQLLQAVLRCIQVRMARVSIVYPVPNRVSLGQVQETLAAFLSQRSGGVRLQACSVALFQTIGERFSLFETVTSTNVNAADASTGNAADLECRDSENQVVVAVEVKDRQLTLRQAEDKLPSVRDKGIRELLFVVQGGVAAADDSAIRSLIERQFVTGQNIYVRDFTEFTGSVLVLLGETGRRRFLQLVGETLESSRADFGHRESWRNLLQML
ncbi:MAG: restriction endonuclease, SacI family [Pirellulales bacterium]